MTHVGLALRSSACFALQIEKVLFTTEQLNEILDDLGR